MSALRWPWSRPREAEPDARTSWRELIDAARPVERHRVTVLRRRNKRYLLLTPGGDMRPVLDPGWRWSCSCTSWRANADWTREDACESFRQHYAARSTA